MTVPMEMTCRRGAIAQLESAVVTPLTDITPGARDPGTAALLERLSPARYSAYLSEITTPVSRLSSSAGYTAALDVAEMHMQTAGYTVTRMPVDVGDHRCDNLVAEMVGTATDRGAVLVTAHLDSVNHRDGPAAPAPGADDNASGSAGALELAAVLATREWPHDLRIILFGGEEQGLFGSRAYVAALPAAERDRIRAVLNMDMIGRRNGAVRGVLLEGAPVSQHLIDRLATAAATWTGLAVSSSLHPFASDHVPFIDAGVPAVLTIEGDDPSNTDVHTAGDTVEKLDSVLAEQILRMNSAALAGLLSG